MNPLMKGDLKDILISGKLNSEDGSGDSDIEAEAAMNGPCGGRKVTETGKNKSETESCGQNK
jgi:hypothetical protein